MNNTMMTLVRETNVSSLAINEAENNGVFRSLIMLLFHVTRIYSISAHVSDCQVCAFGIINNIDHKLEELQYDEL